MSKMREFDNILNECLGRLIAGESIEACLMQYPEHAAELEPLLQTALDAMKATAIEPRPEFRQKAASQFQAAIHEMESKESRGFFTWVPRWATVVSVIVVILAAGSGTVAASAHSLPDSPLYQVKLATETVRLALTPSDLGKAELNARFADERVDEIIKMAEKGDAELIEKTTDRMNQQLIAVANLTATGEATVGSAQFNALQAPVPVTDGGAPTVVPSPVSTPAPTIAPAPEGTPPPVTTVVTPPEGEAPLAVAKQAPATNEDGVRSQEDSANNEGGKPDQHERLKNTLSQQSLENLQALQDALDKAPESIKPEIQRAIDIILSGYEISISNLAGY